MASVIKPLACRHSICPLARVFDCLDLITYPDVEADYIANSDLVLCTSRVLLTA